MTFFHYPSEKAIAIVSVSLDPYRASVDDGTWYIFLKLWPTAFIFQTFVPQIFVVGPWQVREGTRLLDGGVGCISLMGGFRVGGFWSFPEWGSLKGTTKSILRTSRQASIFRCDRILANKRGTANTKYKYFPNKTQRRFDQVFGRADQIEGDTRWPLITN